MVQLMTPHPQTPSSLASFKSRLVLPFWYRFTKAVLENRPLNMVVVVVVVLAAEMFVWSRSLPYANKENNSFYLIISSNSL